MCVRHRFKWKIIDRLTNFNTKREYLKKFFYRGIRINGLDYVRIFRASRNLEVCVNGNGSDHRGRKCIPFHRNPIE